jgi:hypothetical protein
MPLHTVSYLDQVRAPMPSIMEMEEEPSAVSNRDHMRALYSLLSGPCKNPEQSLILATEGSQQSLI